MDEYLWFRYYAPARSIRVGIGVRALVRGTWGFAGLDGIASTDQAAVLGRSAAAEAARAGAGQSQVLELAPAPVVSGTWVMPGIDPFSVPIGEKFEYLMAMQEALRETRLEAIRSYTTLNLCKDERTFASSDGSFVTQTTFTTGARWEIDAVSDSTGTQEGHRVADYLTPAGAGWEYLCTQPLHDRAQQLVEDGLRSQHVTPVNIGRYDVVFDAASTAALLDCTLGTATELDRAMGMVANTVGTSYLTDPVAMLGMQQVASPLITVTANRSMFGGAATVRWDDEGIAPPEATLIKNGILNDFQTTRESATWLAPAYQRLNRSVTSNGCAHALGSTTPVTQRRPNLVLQPGTQALSFEDLVKNTKRGIAIIGGEATADYQALNGTMTSRQIFSITNGVIGTSLSNAEVLFRAPELWRSVEAIGGAATARTFGFERWRDREEDRVAHSVASVPIKVTNLAVGNVYYAS